MEKDVSCTPQRMEVDSSQRVNTDLATPVVEKEKDCTPSGERSAAQTQPIENPQMSSEITQPVSTREVNVQTQVRTNTQIDTNSVSASTIVHSIVTNPNPDEFAQLTIQNASTHDLRVELVHPVPLSSKTTGTQTDPSERENINVNSVTPNSSITTAIPQCDITALHTEQIEVPPTIENLNQASTSMHVPSMSV